MIYIAINKKIIIEEQGKKLIKLSFYLLVINIISVIIMFCTDNLYAVNEYLPIKAMKGYLFFVTNTLFFILLTNLQHKLDVKKIFYPFFITFIILFIVLIIEKINPNLINIFHNNVLYNEQYGRIRLLTAEESYTSTLIILNFVLALFYTRYLSNKKIMSIALIVMFIIFLLLSYSKGLLVSFFISMALIILFNNTIKFKNKIILLCVFIILAIVLFPNINHLFKDSIEKYTSITTRIYTFINATIISIQYPVGVGNGMYLKVYIESLKNRISILEKLPIQTNIAEINNIIDSTSDTTITAKSGILQYAIYWGIFGTIIFFSFLYNIYKKISNVNEKSKTILQFGFIFLIISITFYVNFDSKYEIFGYLSVITYYINNIDKFSTKGVKDE